ncbi:hypothetical protein V2J09_001480 [Rumex salicifolius]
MDSVCNKRACLGLVVALVFSVGAVCCQGWQLQVPGFFIFGDSLVDNGNNNNMLTLARANYYPYGIDFTQGVTGRFTNGRTFVDALVELLGFTDYIPPYSNARGNSIVRGVNFASGASGIRDETGNNLGGHMSMNEQVNNFARLVGQMRRIFRGDDFLYQMGARKVVVTAVGKIGCIPYQLARYENKTGGSHCNEGINSAINLFNVGLKRMVDRFNGGQLPGAKFVYLDSYQGTQDLAASGNSFGFKVVDKACCGVGKNNGQITCLPLQSPCENRNEYIFWDAFHPTEAANIILAKRAYNGRSKSYAYPINIRQLALA